MINQATSIIAEALLYSLLAGAVAYIVLRVLLTLLKNISSLIKYHLCNISLLIPLLVFILSLTKLTTVKDTAPVYPTPPPVATIYNNTQDYAPPVEETTVQDSRLTAEVIWTELNSVIVEHSYTITWLYIAGLLLFSIRLLLQYLQSQQLKTTGLLPATDSWHRLLAATMSRLRIKRSIHIAFTERKISPCIIGHAKAVILIPISLANHLSTEQAEAILLHELAHYKQYDHYINLGVQCVKCLLFFNPFIWMQAVLIDKYREISCDETATRHERNIELAETLALIAGIQSRQNSLVMSLKKKSPLLARVQALLHIREYHKSSHRLLPLVTTTIILATGLLIAGSTKLFSTEKDNLREQLKEISAQMYKEGNHKYIFVDAVLDSLVTLPAKVEILYMGNNNLFIGTNKLDSNIKYRYSQKLKHFLVQHGEDGEHVTIIAPMPDKKRLTLAHIINPSSDFRKCTAYDRYNANITTRAWQQVFSELYDDQLIQSTVDRFEMHYSKKGIIINRDTLRGEQDVKYRKLFKDVVGINLDDNSVSGSMTIGDLKKYLTENITITERDTAGIGYQERNIILAKLFNELQKDGLADTNHRTEIEYRNGQVFLNLVQLETEAPKKYTGLLQKAIFYSGKADTQSTTYTWYIDKPFPQYYYDRLNRFTEIEMLQHVSDELFNKGLTDYIMVDAVKDGYLQNGESYHIAYKDGVVTIKGKTLRINDQIAYNNKLKLYTQQFESNSWYGSTRSTVKMSDILDPESGLRTKSRNNEDPSVNKNYMYDIMIAMHEEGILDTAYQVRIRYNSLDNRLFVNEVKLEGATADKYTSIIRKNEPGIRKGKKVSLSYQKNTEKNLPPDNKTGMNLSEQQRLNKVSDELFRKGHQGFIIAELVKDGYIKKGERYKVAYKNGKFSMEGKSLPTEVIKSYEEKMAKFTAAHPRTATVWWSLDDTYDATNAADEFNMKLGGGTPSDYEKEQKEKERDENFKKMIQAMHDDGLLDVKSYYLVEYKEEGVYVNAIKLTGGKARKYTEWLHELGYTAGKGLLTESLPDGVKIPPKRLGRSVITMHTQGNNLPAIAQVMFVDGNPNFILAHALHDGVLRERQDYNFRFTGGKTYFNDKLLPAPYQAKYTKLMKDFMQAHGHKSDKYITRGDGVTKKQLNTPESPIRKHNINKGRNEQGAYYVDRVIKMMAADGLIDTTQKHTMKYNAHGIFVNGKKLDEKDAAKYEAILKEGYGRSPRWTASDGISYSNEP